MALSKEEYLKRYLTGSNNEKKTAKKKKSSKALSRQTGMKILDDDVDFKSLLPSNLKNSLDDDLTEDKPTVVDLGLDDRPEKMKELERMRLSKRWKVISQNDDDEPRNILGEENPVDPKRTKDRNRKRYDSESDSSPQRKRVETDDDVSPQRKRTRAESDSPVQMVAKRRENVDNSPPRQRLDSNSDSDNSSIRRRFNVSDNLPPRRRNNQNDSDNSPPRGRNQDNSPPRRNNQDDSDNSPPRGRNQDNSPPRRRNNRNDSDNSPPRNRNQDNSPPRRRNNYNRDDSDNSPPRGRNQDNSPPRRRNNRDDSDSSPPRRSNILKNSSSLSKTNASRKYDSDSDVYRPRATLQHDPAIKKYTQEKLQKDLSQNRIRTDDKTPVSASPEVIYRKDGKKRDLEAERKEKDKEEAKKSAMAAKYKEWNKGLKQKQMADENLVDALRESEKPLARYKDDQDLDVRLRDQDREGDPMLAFIKKKKSNTAGSSRPRYNGPQPPPNRYNIQPGYRWDGVDRSNGFEKKFFSKLSEDKAKKEIAYKWSTEDM